MMRKYFLKKQICLITTLLVLVGCLPSQKKSATCGIGEVFDTASRTCQKTATLNTTNNRPQFISTPNTVSGTEDTSYPLQTNAFTVDEGGGNEENSQTVTFSFSSDNSTLMPDSAILISNYTEFGGIDAMGLSPRVSLTPASDQNGTANVTVTINDGEGGINYATFSLSIAAVNDAPTFNGASGISDTSTVEDASITVSFTADEGGASDEDTQTVTLVGLTSDSALINVNNTVVSYNGNSLGTYSGGAIVLNDSGDAAATPLSLIFTPAAETSGTANITVTLSDGINTNTDIFAAVVTSANDAPSYITQLSSPATVNEDVAAFELAFKVDEGPSATEDLDSLLVTGVTTTSTSNTALFPAANIRFRNFTNAPATYFDAASLPGNLQDGAGDSSDDDLRMELTPATNENGTATFAITFADSGTGNPTMDTSTISLITVTVAAVNDVPVFTNVSFPLTTTINEGVTSFPMTFNIDEGGASDEDVQIITLSASTSDNAIIANSSVTVTFAVADTATSDANVNPVTATFNLSNTDVNTKGGTMNLTITADDGVGGTTSTVTALDIQRVNDNPVFISATPDVINSPVISLNAGEVDKLVTMKIGEGGNPADGDTYEIADTVTVSVTSSNTALVPQANITISYNGASVGDASAVRTLDNAAISARDNDTVLDINFVSGITGNTTITVVADDQVAGSTPATMSFTIEVANLVAVHNGWENIVAVGQTTHKDNGTTNPYSIIQWRDMSIYVAGTLQTANSSAWNWNVYRAAATAPSFSAPRMDYEAPINATPIPAGTSVSNYSYTDTTVTAGTVYYYEVRPMLVVSNPNTSPIPTSQTWNKVRVVVPPDNMALVHRWMANQEACEVMGQTPDRNFNHRCPYAGAGRLNSNTSYFDMNYDTAMDVVEAGCNYTAPNTCSNSGCIDALAVADNPNTNYGAYSTGANDVFYDRTSGSCYVSNSGASTWGLVNTLIANYGNVDASVLGIPPLTGINQADAHTYCQARSLTCAGAACGYQTDLMGAAATKHLMSKKQFTVAAAWDKNDSRYNSDTKINTVEGGTSLSTTGYCNTDAANGMTFFPGQTPPSGSFYDTLPFTDLLGEKKLRTGSTATQNCKSRYAIQDLVGNVREWVSDRCTHDMTDCTGLVSASGAALNQDIIEYGYNFDGSTAGQGPSVDTAGFTETVEFSALTYLFTPIGLPHVANGGNEIGQQITAASFPTTAFHGDIIDFNEGLGANIRGFAVGGHSDFVTDQTDANDAGRWTLELLTETTADADTGFRCVVNVSYP